MIALAVENFFIKAKLFTEDHFLSSRNEMIWLYINFSIILSKWEKRDIVL